MKTEEEIEELLNSLKKICSELGWLLSFNETSDAIYGMVIGNEEYVARILEEAEDFSGYETYQLENKKRELH